MNGKTVKLLTDVNNSYGQTMRAGTVATIKRHHRNGTATLQQKCPCCGCWFTVTNVRRLDYTIDVEPNPPARDRLLRVVNGYLNAEETAEFMTEFDKAGIYIA